MLTLTSNLILGETPQTVAGLIIVTSINLALPKKNQIAREYAKIARVNTFPWWWP